MFFFLKKKINFRHHKKTCTNTHCTHCRWSLLHPNHLDTPVLRHTSIEPGHTAHSYKQSLS